MEVGIYTEQAYGTDSASEMMDFNVIQWRCCSYAVYNEREKQTILNDKGSGYGVGIGMGKVVTATH